MKLALLILVAIPVSAAAPVPEPIFVSPEERQAIIDKFGEMIGAIEHLQKSLKVCQSTRST